MTEARARPRHLSGAGSIPIGAARRSSASGMRMRSNPGGVPSLHSYRTEGHWLRTTHRSAWLDRFPFSIAFLTQSERHEVPDVANQHLAHRHSLENLPYRLMRRAEIALPAQSTATIGKMIDVLPVWSMTRPIRGSPRPAHAYDMKLRTPVAVPERRRPKISGQSAQNDDAGPKTKNPQRNSAAMPSKLPCGTIAIAMATSAARTM